jgi:hypothetical protein
MSDNNGFEIFILTTYCICMYHFIFLVHRTINENILERIDVPPAFSL